MANEEHLAILRQGVEVWNAWRTENAWIALDLRGAELSGMDLWRVNLTNVDLRESILYGTNLSEANLSGTNLREADLSEANLYRVDLSQAHLAWADLSVANLHGSHLVEANFTGANLKEVDLREATLIRADLSRSNLVGANLTRTLFLNTNMTAAMVGETTFDNVDLRQVQGLDTFDHQGPSTIGIDTLYRSKGQIPEVFLRGCGVPDSMIEYARSLVAAEHPIDYYSCFISHSSHDTALAERLYADLQAKGVRCWYAPHDMQIGEPILDGIDRGIRLHDKLLLILSEASVESGWVEQEVHMALAREKTERRRVLFPIRLDDAVIESRRGWPAILRETIHIGDFRQWKDHDMYQSAFARLLRDLKAEKE